ncbi:MAG: hypothetical protein OQJ87_04055 [Rhodospirillales bacterium]|nr:hypothetical protein [Rhodospirillales bacterium]MCW9001871.1 hypothetical protein [Rhodospirillales bacterium]
MRKAGCKGIPALNDGFSVAPVALAWARGRYADFPKRALSGPSRLIEDS